MSLLSPKLRWLRITLLSLGLGWIGGAFEAIQIGGLLRLSLSFQEMFIVGLIAAACGGAVALVCGLFAGLVVQLIGRKWMDHVAYAAGMTLAVFLLSGFYLWYGASVQWEMGKTKASLAMLVYPIGVAGVTWFNAKYWARREEIAGSPRFGWSLLAPLAAVALAALAGVVGEGRGNATSSALAGDPNVLIVTVDTLRRDHVGAFNPFSPASTPNMDRLGESGVLFLDAVTPTPETAPSHASMFTSLHPLRHKVLHNGVRLAWGHVTLAERLRDEGYATAAFLSSYAVNHRAGLDQGFAVYDDDFIPSPRGVGQILLVQHLMRLAMASGQPHRVAPLLERSGKDTVDIAEGWMRRQGEGPWFAWVHLFDPHAPYEGESSDVDHRALLSDPGHVYTDAEREGLRALYAEEVEEADEQVGRLLDALDEMGVTENTLVIVLSDHGEQLGEHGVDFHHHGLWEESIRIPLIIRAPGRPFRDMRIPQQVRVMDIAPTALAYIKLDPLEPAEGVELLGYPLGLRKKSLVSDLFGRKTANLQEGCLFGLRTEASFGERDVRAKYIVDPETNQELFFNVLDDPKEERDLAALQPDAVEASRARVRPSLRSSPCGEWGEVRDGDVEMLRALGYIDEAPGEPASGEQTPADKPAPAEPASGEPPPPEAPPEGADAQ